MKRCPECNRIYPDDTLSFCLDDGTLLSAPYRKQETQSISHTTEQSSPNNITEVLNQAETDPLIPPTLVLPPSSIPNITPYSPLKTQNISLWLALGVAAIVLIIGVAVIAVVITRGDGVTASGGKGLEQRRVSDEALVKELVALHQQYYTAADKGDIAAVARVLADDYNGGVDKDGNPITADKDGNPINKNERLARIKANSNVSSDTISNPKLVSRTETTVAIRFTNTLTFKTGTPPVIDYQVMGRYVKRDGRWQIISSVLTD